jgi:indolepyruvate ferredoxin oxidoreductase
VASLNHPRLTLDSKYTADTGTVFCSGVQALVRLIFDQLRRDQAAGLRTAALVSGYPGSPLGGFDRELARQGSLIEHLNVVHIPGHNEELAASSIAGSQLVTTFASATVDGVLGVWYGKAPGLDRAMDALRHAQFIGASRTGGALAFVGDDPACKSSTLPSASEPTIAALQMPILEPGTVQDVLALGRHGVAISRASGLWCSLRVATPVADGTASVQVDSSASEEVVWPTLHWRGAPYVPTVRAEIAGAVTVETECEITEARVEMAKAYASANGLNRIEVDPPAAWLGIVSRGTAYEATVAALANLGLDENALSRYGVRLLKMRMVWPLEREIVQSFARGLEEILVVEEKRGFLETLLREALYGGSDTPRIVGKQDQEGRPLVPAYGTLSPVELTDPLADRLSNRIPAEQFDRRKPTKQRLPVLTLHREAYFCSGCPHNSSTVVPDGVLVGAGIGCHALASRMDPKRFGNAVVKAQMGGEGAGWFGIEPFVAEHHLIQNVGDGTYFHSAQLAVQAAVAAGSNITYKLLYNGAIAMTGGQDPGVSNARPVSDVTSILLHQGVRRVLVTTDDVSRYRKVRLPKGVEVWDRSRLVEAQEVLSRVAGVTVLIHDQTCAAELRRGRKRGSVRERPERLVINERVCEGCGDCGEKSNCLSVEPVDTEWGRKTTINQTSCNNDMSCLSGDCPAFVTVTPAAPHAVPPLPSAPSPDNLPAPEPMTLAHPFHLRMPGIGGTGVVTVNQILGTAALLDSMYVTGIDQTGLSQKAGPVVSDLRLWSAPLDGTPDAGIDLYLAFDVLTAMEERNLVGVGPTTRAVISTSRLPTGTMVSHPSASFPELAKMKSTITDIVDPANVRWIDGQAVTRAVLGDTATANILMLGVAVQAGYLPVSTDAIEEAIELNGVAVPENIAAFRWGRQWAIHPAVIEAKLTAERARTRSRKPTTSLVVPFEGDLGSAVRIRANDLVDYQDERYAQRYIDDVARVADAELRVSGAPGPLADSFSRYLYKLMAYKDEYEVARLLLDEGEQDRIYDTFGAGARVQWNLHPPLLRALGMKSKIRLGGAFKPALMALRAARRLRGTPLDPFHRTEVRSLERAILADYRATMLDAARNLTSDRLEAATRLARLPDMIRGYEQVKLRNVDRYNEAFTALKSEVLEDDLQTVAAER